MTYESAKRSGCSSIAAEYHKRIVEILAEKCIEHSENNRFGKLH